MFFSKSAVAGLAIMPLLFFSLCGTGKLTEGNNLAFEVKVNVKQKHINGTKLLQREVLPNQTLGENATSAQNESQTLPAPTEESTEEDLSFFTTFPSGVRRHDKENRFTLPGSWKEAPMEATQLFDSSAACGKGKRRVYPVDMHGCCSDKPTNSRPSPNRAFWPSVGNFTSDNTAILALLQAARGRSILFVGDSITLNMCAGIAMEMTARSIPFNRTEGARRCKMDIIAPRHNVRLTNLYHYQIEDPLDPNPKKGEFFPKLF